MHGIRTTASGVRGLSIC